MGHFRLRYPLEMRRMLVDVWINSTILRIRRWTRSRRHAASDAAVCLMYVAGLVWLALYQVRLNSRLNRVRACRPWLDR